MWYRLRKKSAAGLGSWEYSFTLNDLTDADIKNIANEYNEQYYWSERHRGVDIEILKDSDVPAKEIRKHLEEVEAYIEHHTKKRTALLNCLLANQLDSFDKVKA